MITIGPVIGTKEWVEAFGLLKPIRDVCGRQGPGVTGLVAAGAAATIRAEALEKWTGEINLPR